MARRAQRARGELSRMLDMPLDVIREICGHLQTKDMLHLSRLSKGFRAFFTSRSTQSIWKLARLNVPGLPPCPENLNELAFADLVYDTRCYYCMVKNCQRIYWTCGLRICQKCYENGDEFRILYGEYSSREFHLYDDTTKGLLNDYDRVIKLVPELSLYGIRQRWQYRPRLEAFILAWKETPEEDREKFEEECMRSTAAVQKTAGMLHLWYCQSKISRSNNLNKLRIERQDAVMDALRLEGWKLEVDYLEKNELERRWLRERFSDLRKPQALTQRAWKVLKGPITDYMQGVRERRRQDLMHSLGTLPSHANRLCSRSMMV